MVIGMTVKEKAIRWFFNRCEYLPKYKKGDEKKLSGREKQLLRCAIDAYKAGRRSIK